MEAEKTSNQRAARRYHLTLHLHIDMVASDKRKGQLPTSHRSKKRKTAHTSLDDLSWRPVVRTHAAGLDFDEGLLELEEVEGVQVVYEQTANGRVAKFLVSTSSWVIQCVIRGRRTTRSGY